MRVAAARCVPTIVRRTMRVHDDGAVSSPEEPGMLKNIDPVLSPELLSTLRAMGHGDELAIVDANYPAVSSGGPVIRWTGWPLPRRSWMPCFR